jgi:hypothetical protein
MRCEPGKTFMISLRWQAISDGRLPAELVSNVVCDIASISQSTQEQQLDEEKMDCVITLTNLSKIAYTVIPDKFQGTANEEGDPSKVNGRSDADTHTIFFEESI